MINQTLSLGPIVINKNEIDFLKERTGATLNGDPIIRNAPLCKRYNSVEQTPNNRNVIVLVLESVGLKQMNAVFQGQKVMPNLKKIASDNLFFKNAIASGTKSRMFFPGFFSGYFPQTRADLLWNIHKIKIDAFPKILNSNNYKTAYFHGGDLAFENQRTFLTKAGIQEIYDYHSLKEKKMEESGWGYDDGIVFKKLQEWISNYNNKKSSNPYFATMFSLTTHHPFTTPKRWLPHFNSSNSIKPQHNKANIDMYNTYRFLDEKLWAFYRWYLEFEKENNTILIITADHTQHIFPDTQFSAEKRKKAFQIPLIISGLSPSEIKKYKKYSHRQISTYDINKAIPFLLGINEPNCSHGQNFLINKDWNDNRIVFSVAGDSMERIYLWSNKYNSLYDRQKNTLQITNYKRDKERSKYFKESQLLIDNLVKINAYMYNNDFYTLDNTENSISDIYNQVTAQTEYNTFFVSHRGNISTENQSDFENSLISMEQVMDSEFEWVEVDIQLTKDEIPIAMHDSIFFYNGKEYNVSDINLSQIISMLGEKKVMTLEFLLQQYASKINLLIEGKTQKSQYHDLILTRKVCELVNRYKTNKEVIFDSFQVPQSLSAKKMCNCQIAIDLPYKQPINNNMLKSYKNDGVDWIYIHYSVFNEEAFKTATKLGLKIMVYTVNDENIIKGWKHLPHGIITDSQKVLTGFNKNNH